MNRLLQRKCACGGTPGPTGECAECRKKRLGLQRKEVAQAPTVAPPIVHEVLRRPGRPLEPETRGFMENRFGHDFGKVRVHADAEAAESARSVGALAYTVGNHVAFDHGHYAPGSGAGKELLAHELAHVVQQGASAAVPASGGLPVSPAGDALESQADSAAAAVIRGASPQPGQAEEPGLRRRPRRPGRDFGGSTLPYREATELLKCNEIMKDPEYCRREVLGEEPIRPTAGCGWFAVKMTPFTTGTEGTIEFYPDVRSCPKCKLIRLVQTVRVFEKPGESYKWPGGEAPREKVKTKEDKKKGVEGGYFVDHLAARCSKGAGCSVYYRDHAPHATKSQDGSNDGTTAVHASLWDRPRGDANDVFEFETCARCHDTGELLGCVDWGFTADATGKATMSSTFEHGSPSATFTAALKAFNKYYKNP